MPGRVAIPGRYRHTLNRHPVSGVVWALREFIPADHPRAGPLVVGVCGPIVGKGQEPPCARGWERRLRYDEHPELVNWASRQAWHELTTADGGRGSREL